MKLFKGNADELKVIDAVSPVFDSTSESLDEMYAGASDSSAFLLMLYDENRVPYAQRIKRDSFVNFYREALSQFPVTGTFDSYLFILGSVFGFESEIFFDTPSPGTLEITLNIVNELTYDFIGRDSSGEFLISTQDGIDTLAFRGISGFESEHDIELLFSELVPVGILPTYLINFYEYFNFVAEDDSTLYDMIDSDGNIIVFYEIGV